jgi:hypothetical protein
MRSTGPDPPAVTWHWRTVPTVSTEYKNLMGPDCSCGHCKECTDRRRQKERTVERGIGGCVAVLVAVALVVLVIVLAFSAK